MGYGNRYVTTETGLEFTLSVAGKLGDGGLFRQLTVVAVSQRHFTGVEDDVGQSSGSVAPSGV